MKGRLPCWKSAAIAALAVALAWPVPASAQRRDDERRSDVEVRLRATEGRLADALRKASLRMSRAQLGVSIEDGDAGARVVDVLDDGPAEKAGLQEGDVIIALDGVGLTRPVEGEDGDEEWGPSHRLMHLMADVDPGDVVRVDYTRDGRQASADIEVTERRGMAFFHADAPLLGNWRSGASGGLFSFSRSGAGFMGADLADVNEGLGSYFGVGEGALVLDVDDDENGLGLRPGDVIVEIGGRDVRAASDAYRILGSYEDGERLRVVVVRERGRVTLEGTAD